MTKPYCIGSDEWNGLSKLIEELGELQQVCGKLVGSEGSIAHWSGNLQDKFVEELGDVYAAMDYFIEQNLVDLDSDIAYQAHRKLQTFRQWDKDVRDANNS